MLVVKAGGRALAQNMEGIVKDIARVSKNEQVVFVHGGGDEVTDVCRKLSIEPKFVVSPEGIRSRYTDEKELEVYVMVMGGKLNKTIVSKLVALNVNAIGISGVDGPTLIAERKKKIVVVDERGRKRVIDGGYTGKIVRVEKDLINKLLNVGYVVVLAPIAVDNEGTLLNVDGDQAAYAIASALKATYMILLTDVEGVIIDGALIKRLKVSEVEDAIKSIGFGMNRKVMLAKRAVEEGVSKAVISSGLIENPISGALQGIGTVIELG
uniref:Putative [LysW]-aminoadipate/[LysW]-glutamate kinase n=1 Tax=Ignisphaera aggregans TaxID=334771 RepID=A0A7C4NNB9_9CREN